MSVLLDTNILTRSSEPRHPMHQVAVDAVAALLQQGEDVFLVPRNKADFARYQSITAISPQDVVGPPARP